MKKLLLLLLLLVTSAYCQDITGIKTLDTIFVHFKEDKYQTKTLFPIDHFGFQKRWYTIILGNDQNRKFIRFYFQEYINPEKRKREIKSGVRLVSKSFLKNHKQQTVGLDFFKRENVCTLRELFYGKVVYVIDIVEIKKKKSTL